jgi:hypothetical protein
MEQSIAKGESPLQASSTARKSKKEFNDAIKKMEADHKMSWDQIVASVFGQEAKAMQPKQEQSPLQRMLSPAENPQEQTAAQQAAMQLMGSGQAQQPMQPQQMQQQGQGGQGEQRLLAALQELKKLRGG